LRREVSASDKNSDDCNNRRRKPKGQGYDIAGGDCGENKSCDKAVGFLHHGAYAFRCVHSRQELDQRALKSENSRRGKLQT
jgi:hypothetical protein